MTPFSQLGHINKQAGLGNIAASVLAHGGQFAHGLVSGGGDMAHAVAGLAGGGMKGINAAIEARPLTGNLTHNIGRMAGMGALPAGMLATLPGMSGSHPRDNGFFPHPSGHNLGEPSPSYHPQWGGQPPTSPKWWDSLKMSGMDPNSKPNQLAHQMSELNDPMSLASLANMGLMY